MLARLVHKDNKDISFKPTKLPPGRSRKEARREKEQAIADERAKQRLECPISDRERFGDVELAIKKARVEGMKSHSEKIAVDSIVAQVNLLCENQEKYREMIVNLLNKLPGVPAPEATESVSQEGVSSSCRVPGSSRKGMEVTILGKDNFSLSDDE